MRLTLEKEYHLAAQGDEIIGRKQYESENQRPASCIEGRSDSKLDSGNRNEIPASDDLLSVRHDGNRNEIQGSGCRIFFTV